MTIEGIVEDIIFRNEENGYTVFSLDNDGVLLTCVGSLITLSVGENLLLEGNYSHSKYGEQFAFTHSETIMPKTVAGIVKYLSSGLIKGIGPVTATNIVKFFKDATLDVISMAPERLSEVKGISSKKALEIGDKFKELRKMQNAIIFLQEFEITTNMALRIYETYGEKTLDFVKNNPYRMVEEVDGIGFLSADRIAAKMGIAKQSEFRVRAGILHTLNSASEKNGHTFLPLENLIDETTKILELSYFEYQNLYDDALANLKIDKVVTIFNSHGGDVAMMTKLYFTENSVAQKLALLNATSINSEHDLNNEISAYEQIYNIRFHSDQKEAIQTAVNSGVSVITGGPGTGKTTIVKCILSILDNLKKDVLLLAPTGRAAKRLSDSTGKEAKTIHRALEINFNSKSINFNYNEQNPLEIDCVIVDEVSMVDVSLMNSLLKALKRDCKLILVGDKDQLPSVGAGNVLDDILKSEVIQTVMLSRIYRQSDKSLIITNAHSINEGKMPTIDNSSSDFFFDQKEDLTDIKTSIIEMVTKRIPKFIGVESSQIQVLAPLKAGVCGIDNLNKSLQERLNPPAIAKHELIVGTTIFRVGDKIMQTSNNYNLAWKKEINYLTEEGEGVFNGDIGTISQIDFQTGEMIVTFEDGRRCTYPRTDLTQLSLAYAITIHKSQGSEFDVVIIPAISGPSIILNRNLIYTAVTRAKKMVVIVGDKKNLRRMISNIYTLRRFTMLKQFIIDSDKKIKALFE